MRAVGKFFAVIAAFLFVVASLAVMLSYNWERELMTSSTFKDLLAQQDVYGKLPVLLAGELVKQAQAGEGSALGGMAAIAKDLKPDEISGFVETLAPQTKTRFLAEGSIDQIFDFLNGATDHIQISVEDLLLRVRQHGLEAIHRLSDGKPDCTAKQMSSLGPEMVTICKLPAAQQKQFDTEMQKSIDEMTQNVPPQFEIVTTEGAKDL